MADVNQFNQSTFLAAVTPWIEQGPPESKAVSLAGSRASITTEELLAHQSAGKSHAEIVALVNERADAGTAVQREQAIAWSTGPYRTAIEEQRREFEQRVAFEMRAQSVVRKAVEYDAQENG